MYRAYAWRRGRSGRSSEDQTSTHCQHASWLNHLWLKVYTSTHLVQFLISCLAGHSDLRGRSGPISQGSSWYFSTIQRLEVRHEWRIPRTKFHLPTMKISIVSPMAEIVSALCMLCVRLFGVYSCLNSNRSAGFETCMNAVTCYRRWFHVREIDSDFLPEEDSCCNPVSFLARDTRVRGCNEVIVGRDWRKTCEMEVLECKGMHEPWTSWIV